MIDLLITTARRTIAAQDLFSPNDLVVVAVSGGPDSVCLLSVLHTLSKDLGISLQVAHLDHMFRGEESAREARFVADLAGTLGLPATIDRRDVPSFCSRRGCSSQEGAREVRYAFLEDVANRIGAQRIAVGHTASDQAETVLLRLLRGAGLAGLSGMPPRRDRIVRPLIDVTRGQVMAYLAERGLPFVTDPSNTTPVYTRNRVRHEVLPVLELFNPRITETLAAEAAALREELIALDFAADRLLGPALQEDGDLTRIDRAALLVVPPALQRRAVRRAMDRLAPGSDLSFVQTGEVLAFLQNARSGREMELPAGLVLAREYDSFIVRPATESLTFDRELAVPGLTGAPELCLDIETEVRKPAENRPETANYLWQAEFDYAKIALPLRLRSRRPGDILCPAGMGGRSKKLQDLFVDEKVPRQQRDRIPLLAMNGELLWVVGLRTDERFLPGPDTEQVLVVTIRDRRREIDANRDV